MVDLIDPRGTSARGTANRITTPDPPQDYPPFSLQVMGLMGQAAIPDALAYALKWQFELDLQQVGHPEPTEAQQELADNLLAVFDFLLGQQLQVARDPADGALLYLDPLQQYARTPVRRPRLVEITTGEAIPVTDDAPDTPLPAWAPSVFPREISAHSRARYPYRPRTLADIPPFDSPLTVASWLRLRAWRPQPTEQPGARVPPPLTPPHGTRLAAAPRPAKPVDAKTLDDTLNQATARYEANRDIAEAFQPYTRTPLVANAIRQLSSYTMADLRTATAAKIKSPWEDDKLIEHTDVILYHSVFTVVLDRAGNPFDLRATADRPGLLPYAILVPEPGSQMRRALPDPGGVTVSVQRYGDTTFRIEKGEIHKVLAGGVGSFVEYGYGYTGKHDLQKAIEQFLSPGGVYIASVTADAAFSPAEADAGRIYLRLADLADAAEPYVVDEITARLKKMVENWEEIAGQVLREAIKQIILDEIRAQIKKYLIKKIGKKIVPVINALSTAYDLLTRDYDKTRERHAIACAVLAVKGTTEEDTELAAKVVSKICADEFEDKVIQKLVEAATKAGKKIIMHTKKPPSQPKPPAAAKATAPEDLAPPPADPAAGKNPPTQPPTAPPVRESAAEADARRQANEYVNEKMAEAIKSSTATPPADTAKKPQKPTPTADSAISGTHDTAASEANRGTSDTGVPAVGTATPTAGGTPPGRRRRRPARPEVYGPYRQEHEHLMPPRRRRQQPAPPAPPPPPQERGTRDKPVKLDPGPTPPPDPMHVGDGGESAPEAGLDVRRQANVRTGPVSAERLLRSEDEKVRGAFPIDHDAHHTGEKKGGAAQGEAIRDSLGVAGVSVNDAANATRARGLPRDPRAPVESSSQHWGEHTDENRKPLRKELQTVQEDDEATRGVLEKHGRAVYEDRPVDEPEFYLGPDPDESDEE